MQTSRGFSRIGIAILVRLALVTFATGSSSFAANVTLAWDPATASNMAGYNLYWGNKSGVYTQLIPLGNVTATVVSNLIADKTYYFVVTDYTSAGFESPFSNEIAYKTPRSTPTPRPTATPTATPKPTATPTPTPKPTPTPTPTATPTPTPIPTVTPTPTPQPTATPTPSGAGVIISPTPGSTFGSSTVTFTWTPGSATQYVLDVGNSPSLPDIYGSNDVTVHSLTVSNIPTDGRTIYVTLWSQVGANWVSLNYTYKASNH